MTHNSLIVSHNGISVKIILKRFCCIGVDLALRRVLRQCLEDIRAA